MAKRGKILTCAVVLALAGIGGAGAADVYELNPIVVTAQRTKKTEINTPVTETIVTTKKIEEAGYKNAFDIIESQVGLSSTGYGDAGQDFGLSGGRTIIRGYDRGTLVMLDGIPINLKNYNSLDGIPVDMIEKVEIIKGASGTLYGAEAMGGVVNIITKRPEGMKPEFTVKGTVGNYYKDFGVTYQDHRMMIGLQKEYTGEISHANDYPYWSTYDWRNGKGQKNRASIAAKLTDEITADFFYQDGNGIRWAENKKKDYSYKHEDRRMTAGVHYQGKEDGIQVTLGYNGRKTDGNDYGKGTQLQSAANLESYIGDIQKTWDFDKDTLIAGYTYKRESYKGLYTSIRGHRSNNALYLSYDHSFTDYFSATLGLRGEFIDDVLDNQRVFTPQIQTLYKINDTTSWYINVGKAFQMPTVDDELKYSSVTGLKPEKGWTYETGIKKLIGNDSSLRIAVYHMDFDNKIGWKELIPGDSNSNVAYNKGEFRNTGIEAEYDKTVNAHWNYSLGLGFSNPEVRDPSVKNSEWTQDSARIDGTASLTYRTYKLRSTLSYKYLGDREYYKKHGDVPSRSRFTWNTIYDVTDNDTVTLTLNNLFDHKNYANRYGNLELPFNWKLSYSHKF